jgi:hypothetical protein
LIFWRSLEARHYLLACDAMGTQHCVLLTNSTGFRANDKTLGASCSTIALNAGYLPRTVPCRVLISMAEDHVLVLAPKSFASKLGKREGKIGVLNNDVSFDVDAGV